MLGVRHHEGYRIMKIAIAVDGSAHSLHALKKALKLIESLREPPTVRLVIVDSTVPPLLSSRLGEAAVQKYHEGNFREYAKDATQMLRRQGVKFELKTYVAEEPWLGLQTYLDENKCDMLVMGSHGHGSLRGVLLGSVVTKMLASSSVPMFVVHPPAKK
jgi:nucleotide-binding universal stress UspA family protein